MIENKNRNVAEAKSIEIAEENREVDWKSKSFLASFYMGEFDAQMIDPFPTQDPKDQAMGDEICARVEAWCKENLDGNAIDREERIPAHVFKGLAELGLFGIKIPKEYGGLGLSQTNYMRILAIVNFHCASTAATLSAHQSIGVPQPLKLFGTEEQKKKYLPMLAKGAISAFALTEPSVGSDPANMETHAEKSEDGTHWILNGEKLWCTNGVIADLAIVMARTPSQFKDGREIKQISAFIVEMNTPGVEVLHRCQFMGLRGIENGLIRFKNVKVPAENLVGGEGNGLRLALTTLNDGRLGIPAVMVKACHELSNFSNRWAKTRIQWGKPIGEHEAGADKLAQMASGAYAMETLSRFCAFLSDQKDVDIRMEAAAAKLFNTELSWHLIDTALQLRSGRGYETEDSLQDRGEISFPLERALRDARINRIVEGTSEIMHLFLAREALDKHLKIAGALFKKGTFGHKLNAGAKAALFYTKWYPKLWLGGIFKTYPGFDPKIKAHLKGIDKRVRKLARTLFHQMLIQGPKLEMRQLTLARLIDIGIELMVMSLIAARWQSEIRSENRTNESKATYWLHSAKIHVDRLFSEMRHNSDSLARKLARELMNEAQAFEKIEPPALTPLQREKGSDLTSGRQSRRIVDQRFKETA